MGYILMGETKNKNLEHSSSPVHIIPNNVLNAGNKSIKIAKISLKRRTTTTRRNVLVKLCFQKRK